MSFEDLMETSSASSSPFVSSSLDSSIRSIQWILHERGGLAKVVGMAMVPSQFLGPDVVTSQLMVNATINSLPSGLVQAIERIEITGEQGEKIQALIIIPQGADSTRSRCVVYNNPNGCTVPQFLENGLDSYSTPAQVLKLAKCPMIMYDYPLPLPAESCCPPGCHSPTF